MFLLLRYLAHNLKILFARNVRVELLPGEVYSIFQEVILERVQTNTTRHEILIHFILGVLNTQLHSPTLADCRLDLLIFQRRLHPLLQEAIHLLRCTADERCWVEEGVKLGFDWIKVWVFADAVDKIVLESQLLHLVAGLMREDL